MVTADLTSEQVDEITSQVFDSFNVNNSDASANIDYVSTGSVQISIDDKTSETEVIDAMISTLAEVLDIHPQDVTITSVDLETGEVIYEIASETYEETDFIKNQLDTIQIEDMEDIIEDILPTAQLTQIAVNEDIEVDITIIVDGSESENIGQAKRDVEQILGNQGFGVSTDVAIVTPAPSVTPTFTTKIPSPAPSITGIVVTFTLTTSDEILDNDGVSSLTQELAEDYGVNSEDVMIEPKYVVSGSIEINDLPQDVSNEELQQTIEDSIAESLGIHSRNVEVTIDQNTGEVTYLISSNVDEVAANIQNAIESTTFLEDLNKEISSALPATTISSISVDDEIEMELTVTIDASESIIDIQQVNAEVVSFFEDQGFSAESESNNFYRFVELWYFV